MNVFFLAAEFFVYGFAGYLMLYKKDLALLYLPVLVFAYVLTNPMLSASVYYGIISLLILSIVNRHPYFHRNNIFAILLAVYFTLLLFRARELVTIRPYIFGVLWLFTLIPVIGSVYKNYSQEVILKELTRAASMILVLFIVHVLFATAFRYAAHSMYGISSGILYGNLAATEFNLLPLASFLVLLGFLEKKKLFHLAILALYVGFLMLSMRRSVMVLTVAGFGIAVLHLLTQRGLVKALGFGVVALLLGYLVFTTSSFGQTFKDRYELRNLDEREMQEEKRFAEYELLYQDMFVFKDYSPWIGYEPFRSTGNYARGELGDERSLHADLTNIAHSSGLIGVLLYLLMVFTAFRQAYRHIKTPRDKHILLFSAVAFGLFTITGRYTQIECTLLLFLLLHLPLCKPSDEKSPATEPPNQIRHRLSAPIG